MRAGLGGAALVVQAGVALGVGAAAPFADGVAGRAVVAGRDFEAVGAGKADPLVAQGKGRIVGTDHGRAWNRRHDDETLAIGINGMSELRAGDSADVRKLGLADNPLVIEKARIDAEVARLSRLHCEHQETCFG